MRRICFISTLFALLFAAPAVSFGQGDDEERPSFGQGFGGFGGGFGGGFPGGFGRGFGGDSGGDRDRGSDRGDRGGFGGFGRSRGGFGSFGRDSRSNRPSESEQLAALLKRIDVNKNGTLEAYELKEPLRSQIFTLAKAKKIDTNRPISVEKLTSAYKTERDSDRRGGFGGFPGGGFPGGGFPGGGGFGGFGGGFGGGDTASGSSGSDKESDEEEEEAIESAPRRGPPGFGSATASLGFGASSSSGGLTSGSLAAPSSSLSSSSTATTSSSSSTSTNSSGAASGGAPLSSRAKTMLATMDKNKSGVLEKDEWVKQEKYYSKNDKNGDGILDTAEIDSIFGGTGGTSLASASKSSSSSSSSSRSSSSSSRSSSSSSKADAKRYRYVPPSEKLPVAIPSWFREKDEDGDGQVAMHEYATTWSTSKVAEFNAFDLNEDGVITVKECLDASK